MVRDCLFCSDIFNALEIIIEFVCCCCFFLFKNKRIENVFISVCHCVYFTVCMNMGICKDVLVKSTTNSVNFFLFFSFGFEIFFFKHTLYKLNCSRSIHFFMICFIVIYKSLSLYILVKGVTFPSYLNR